MDEIQVITGDDADSVIVELASVVRTAGRRRLILILGINQPRGSTTVERLTVEARRLEDEQEDG